MRTSTQRPISLKSRPAKWITSLAFCIAAASCASPAALPDNEPAVLTRIIANPEAQVDHQRVEVGSEAAPPAPIEPVVAEEPAPAFQAPEPVVQAPAPVLSGHAWIGATMAKYGAYPAADTRFVIGPMPAGCEGADGCTEFSYYDDPHQTFNHVITIRPGQLTEYLLFHEIAHTLGIRDECAADNYARSILGPGTGHYCN